GGGRQSNQRDRALVQIGRDPGIIFQCKNGARRRGERNGHLLKAVAEKPTYISRLSRSNELSWIMAVVISGTVHASEATHRISHPLHEAIHPLLFARSIERDGELVALDLYDVAVAEFLVEHAVADRV